MSSFETVSETLSKCNVCGYPTYVLEQKLQKPGVNIPKWDTRRLIGVNMGFINMHSSQVGLVIKLFTSSISP